jgi:hypothetical protein
MPQIGGSGLERSGGGGQPGRQGSAVQPDPGPDLLGSGQVPPGLSPFPTQ